MELTVNSLKIFIDKVKEQQEQAKNIGLSEFYIEEIKHIYIAIPDEEFRRVPVRFRAHRVCKGADVVLRGKHVYAGGHGHSHRRLPVLP